MAQKLAPVAQCIESAGDLGRRQEEGAIDQIGVSVRHLRGAEEIRDGLGRDELGSVEDGLAEGFQGQPAPERLFGRG